MQNDNNLGGTLCLRRIAPPKVAPVVVEATRFEVIHWGRKRGFAQNGGYIAAIDTASNEELWVLQVYETQYDPELEADVQDVSIASLIAPSAGLLDIEDELGNRYRVDTGSRQATRL
jgi:hypothetical protein